MGIRSLSDMPSRCPLCLRTTPMEYGEPSVSISRGCCKLVRENTVQSREHNSTFEMLVSSKWQGGEKRKHASFH
jgi:hypothetical protein